MPAPPRHPTPPFNNLHPHDRKNTAVMGISIFTYGTSISPPIFELYVGAVWT